MLSDLKSSRKEIQILRGELSSINYKNNEDNKEITEEFITGAAKLTY